jgi:hypothetical protein
VVQLIKEDIEKTSCVCGTLMEFEQLAQDYGIRGRLRALIKIPDRLSAVVSRWRGAYHSSVGITSSSFAQAVGDQYGILLEGGVTKTS